MSELPASRLVPRFRGSLVPDCYHSLDKGSDRLSIPFRGDYRFSSIPNV